LTTIAYRSGELASDSQCSSGGVITGAVTKIARREDGALVGGTGDAGWCHRFMQWFLAGEEGDMPPIPMDGSEGCAGGFIIQPDGKVWHVESNGRFPMDGPYHAWGSGREFALGAMFLGATAHAAVSAAIHHCTGSGGPIVRLTHKD
jgi:hypothetical protein